MPGNFGNPMSVFDDVAASHYQMLTLAGEANTDFSLADQLFRDT